MSSRYATIAASLGNPNRPPSTHTSTAKQQDEEEEQWVHTGVRYINITPSHQEDKQDTIYSMDTFYTLRRESESFNTLVHTTSIQADWLMDVDRHNDMDEDIHMTAHTHEPIDEDVEMYQGIDSILYLVLDTNVLLEDLHKIQAFQQDIQDTKHAGMNGWTMELVIPHIVLQELDALKTSSREISGAARECIAWLYNALKSNLYGLSFQKASDMRTKRETDTNDDLVLACAEQLRDRALISKSYQQFLVFVITNDKNLGLKSMVAEVPHLTSSELMSSPKMFLNAHVDI